MSLEENGIRMIRREPVTKLLSRVMFYRSIIQLDSEKRIKLIRNMVVAKPDCM